MEKRYNTRARLGGFAVSHFLISFAGVAAVIVPLLVSNYKVAFWILVALSIVLLAAYVPMGAWTARRKQWSRPQTFGEGLRYFLAPAAIAWGWGVLVAVNILTEASVHLLYAEFFVTSLLASPAVLMFYMTVVLQDLGMEGWLWLPGFILLAGGLPPALFTLGSLWGSRKLEVRS